MKILVALGHPAQFHLFKNVIEKLFRNGHVVQIVISDKDILKKLLAEKGFDYRTISEGKQNESIFDKALKILRSTGNLFKIVRSFNPDLMVGTLSQPAFVSFFMRIPYVFMGEDDITYTFLQGLITYPFVTTILAPEPTNVSIFKYKKCSYKGYQKLAYLHPSVFKPDISVLKKNHVKPPFYLIRIVNFNAYHDVGIKGLSEQLMDLLIEKMEVHGSIYISSEVPLSKKYAKYSVPVNIGDIHHLLAFSDIYIGDSQSMAVEAAVLGTPSIRFNDFAEKISVLKELEHRYQLTISINSGNPQKLLDTVDAMLATKALKPLYKNRKEKMIADKINVSEFMVWFIEHFPESMKMIRRNPTVQEKFKGISNQT
jgi:uncharacterized protein